MAYNEKLAEKLNIFIKGKKGFVAMRMFGGIGFLLNGNMCFGVHQDYLIIRMGPDEGEKALKQKCTKPFDNTGRPMKGWIMVESSATKTSAQLQKWIQGAITFVKTLPSKL